MLPREIVSFVFPRVSMFPSTSSRETLRLSGKQNSLFPSGAHIKCIMYSGEYDVCFATLSVYPHRASIPKVLGSNPTVARYIFQACPVWIYNQCGNTYIIYKAFVHIKDFFTPVLLDQNSE